MRAEAPKRLVRTLDQRSRGNANRQIEQEIAFAEKRLENRSVLVARELLNGMLPTKIDAG